MAQMGLITALRKTIMEGVSVKDLRVEYKELTDTDKKELVAIYNKEKTFGADIEVVERVV